MKKILLLCFLLLSLVESKSQEYGKNCFYGISFDVSRNANWGYGELVITAVDPYSPAEKAGVKVGDIIMEINGKATYLRDNQMIANLLFGNYDAVTKFTIRNMNTYFKEYELTRKCINYNTVNEQQLSEMFSGYSVEDTNTRRFVLPMRVTPTKSADFADYHSYDFSSVKGDIPSIDENINRLLDRELQSKGLVRDTVNPDIVIQTYYIRIPNIGFTGLTDNPNYTPETWRYDVAKKKMVTLPIFDSKDRNVTSKAQYIIEFGFTLYDRKYLQEGELVQIWDCNLHDYLSSRYSIEEYVRFHTPLMLMQFPFSTKKDESEYTVKFNRYNYTGLYFDTEDLSVVKDIDVDSPAYRAGLRVGNRVRRIDNKPIIANREAAVANYRKFIAETDQLRDGNSLFVDADGKKQMLWNPIYERDIQKAFDKKSSMTSFAYLYKFSDYIDPSDDRSVTIEAWDGMQVRRFVVTPEQRESITIKAF